jgi:hypothetical protein
MVGQGFEIIATYTTALLWRHMTRESTRVATATAILSCLEVPRWATRGTTDFEHTGSIPVVASQARARCFRFPSRIAVTLASPPRVFTRLNERVASIDAEPSLVRD